MTSPLWNIVSMDIPCTACGKKRPKLVDELIHNNSVRCSYCRSEIDISSEGWRSAIEELAESLTHVRRLPPVGD